MITARSCLLAAFLTAFAACAGTPRPGSPDVSTGTDSPPRADSSPGPDLPPEPSHPTVFMRPRDVQAARANVARLPWAKTVAERLVAQADEWAAREDVWLRSVVPGPGAAFAYGFTGCPICGASWGRWGTAKATWDNPGHVTCANGHVLPDADHPDPGAGWQGPDGRLHYFVGSYNAWVVETLTFQALDSLVAAFTLTGNEKYAAKASVILDALAAVYPTCDKGSWDYPSIPPSGRFNRPWYQVARVLIHYTDQYDQLWSSPALGQPSIVAARTRRQNIEENLLRNGAAYCHRESQKGGLTNGEADYLRGALAVGVCLGLPEYVTWATDGPFGIRSLAENNLDRDGGYYETSPMYATSAQGLYFTFLEPLFNYRGGPYPAGLNLWETPKLRRYFELHNLRQTLAGHTPSYGDTPPDLKSYPPPEPAFNGPDYDALERLVARSSDPDVGAMLSWIAGGDVDKLRAGSPSPLGPLDAALSLPRWLIFHGKPGPFPAPKAAALSSDFFGQKGLAILRAGEGAEAQAVLMRFGPSLNHGHLDDLNLNYVARGRELTYDLGYKLGSTHTQVGWAKQTASHNVVVVNETSQLQAGLTGGDLLLFGDLPRIKLAEASSPLSYAKVGSVTQYRRTVALIGEGSGIYLIDLFRVEGGSQHDWFLHAGTETVGLAGLTLGPEEKGSLAGPDIAWGDQQGNDGDIKGHPNKPYWNPPPLNGYGFLTKVRRGKPPGAWSADWAIDATTHLRVHVPADPALDDVITAVAPGLLPAPQFPRARYVVLRHKGAWPLQSRFAAVLDPYVKSPRIVRVDRLDFSGGAGDTGSPLALQIVHADGASDYVFSANDSSARTSGAVNVTVAGRFAGVRVRGGKAEWLALAGATHFKGFGVEANPERDAWRGTIASVDVENAMVTTSAALPATGLEGQVIFFTSPGYSRSTTYRILRVEPAGAQRRVFLHGTTVLGVGRVDQKPTATLIISVIPHDYSLSVVNKDSGFFQGKRLRGTSGATTHIQSITYGQPMTLQVESAAAFQVGETFYYDDLQPGDSFEIPDFTYRTYP